MGARNNRTLEGARMSFDKGNGSGSMLANGSGAFG
jgi:hypothetical protein